MTRRAQLIAIALVTACATGETAASPVRAAARTPAPGPAGVIPATARQLITGVTADWSTTAVTLQRWTRGADGRWLAEGPAWPGAIGKTGAAWGIGLHGAGAPDGRSGPVKREGDSKSPAGAFALRGSYGYAAAPPAHTHLPYVQTGDDWQCVDDAASQHYTHIVDRRAVAVDWHSAEAMRRRDALYTWVVDIAHNTTAAPGAGSCIFFHVWRRPAAVTVGCTAMAEPRMAELLAHLDPTAVYVLLPRAEYVALVARWGLPPAAE